MLLNPPTKLLTKKIIPKLVLTGPWNLTIPTLLSSVTGLRENLRDNIGMVPKKTTQTWRRKKKRRERTTVPIPAELVTLVQVKVINLMMVCRRMVEVTKAKNLPNKDPQETSQEATNPTHKKKMVNGTNNGKAKMLMVMIQVMTPKLLQVMDNHLKVTTPRAWEVIRPSELKDKVTPQLVSRKTTPRLALIDLCSSLSLPRMTPLPALPAAHHPRAPLATQSSCQLTAT